MVNHVKSFHITRVAMSCGMASWQVHDMPPCA